MSTSQNEYITFPIEKVKTIALIAHDGKKKELLEWVREHAGILKHHHLCGTGTTARLVADMTELPVRGYNSGPLGGDQQIGSRIAEAKVDMVIFFMDPLEAQPHDPDVRALLRIAVVYGIPIATNASTADFIITSPFMSESYPRKIFNFDRNFADRLKGFQSELNE